MAIEARFDCPFWHQVVDFCRKSPDRSLGKTAARVDPCAKKLIRRANRGQFSRNAVGVRRSCARDFQAIAS
jgi:hypothetical protein